MPVLKRQGRYGLPGKCKANDTYINFKKPAITQTKSLFFTLPAEVRLKIYRLLGKLEDGLPPLPRNTPPNWTADWRVKYLPQLSSSLLQTCQVVFMEFSAVIYDENALGLRLRGDGIDIMDRGFLAAITPLSMAMVTLKQPRRFSKLLYHRNGGWAQTTAPDLTYLIQRASNIIVDVTDVKDLPAKDLLPKMIAFAEQTKSVVAAKKVTIICPESLEVHTSTFAESFLSYRAKAVTFVGLPRTQVAHVGRTIVSNTEVAFLWKDFRALESQIIRMTPFQHLRSEFRYPSVMDQGELGALWIALRTYDEEEYREAKIAFLEKMRIEAFLYRDETLQDIRAGRTRKLAEVRQEALQDIDRVKTEADEQFVKLREMLDKAKEV